MHPEMIYRIAQFRHEELIGRRRFPTAPRPGRRGLFRRHRDRLEVGAAEPTSIVLLPPPRERAAGHDQRVA